MRVLALTTLVLASLAAFVACTESAPVVRTRPDATAGAPPSEAGAPSEGGSSGAFEQPPGGHAGALVDAQAGASPSAGEGGHAGALEQPEGGHAGDDGIAGASGAPPGAFDPVNVGECDPDGDGPMLPGYSVLWTVYPRECLRWTNATAKRGPDGGAYYDDCSAYEADAGTGCTANYACGTLTVYPGESPRTVRLDEGVVAEYGTIDPVTKACSIDGAGACGFVHGSCTGTVRDECLESCYSAVCCSIDSAQATTCDSQPICG